jgi:hypothetical protein
LKLELAPKTSKSEKLKQNMLQLRMAGVGYASSEAHHHVPKRTRYAQGSQYAQGISREPILLTRSQSGGLFEG